MASQAKNLGVVHAGVGRTTTNWHKFSAVFHDFERLQHDRNYRVVSPSVRVHGYEWRVLLYPGGDSNSDSNVQRISLYLHCVSAEERGVKLKASYNLGIPFTNTRNITGQKFFEKRNRTKGSFSAWGKHSYIPRADVLESSKTILVNGNLTVEVAIQIELEAPPTWTPSNTVSNDMLKFLDSADEDTADVVFQVGKKRRKKTMIYAHRNILIARAPALAALVEGYDTETPFPIEDVEPDTFRQLLRFAYGGEVPDEFELPDEAQTIIDLGDRYGFIGLKLAAESELASSGINVDNACELILFADAKNCAELKEAAIDFFVSNSDEVMESDGFSKIQEAAAVMTELMKGLSAPAARGTKRSNPHDNEGNDYNNMRVRVLRRKLDDIGLDVDGSKQVLINRLREAEANGNEGDESE